jgi:hypothetical protein
MINLKNLLKITESVLVTCQEHNKNKVGSKKQKKSALKKTCFTRIINKEKQEPALRLPEILFLVK